MATKKKKKKSLWFITKEASNINQINYKPTVSGFLLWEPRQLTQM